MKILAISGKNLASLPFFDLRLDTSPLDREGLFAITGPTGAGKSTILDAMCVSLYDRMPRLPKSKAKLSEDENNPFTNLTLSDPRHIMRRGASSCYAETIFMGVDGERYKARWEVPALQRKNAKNLKSQVISLENLDRDELYTDKKRIIQDLIVQKVGLTFDQFCRSVLLAQGDFAAFLKAGGDARAELLERMTGTEIYRDLSKAAHERARLETQALGELQTKMDARAILSPEAREALEKAIETTDANRLQIQATWEEKLRLVAGHEKTQQLRLALHQAELALQQTHQTMKDQEPTRQSLETWEKLSDAREAWSTQQRLTKKHHSTQTQHQQLLVKLPHLEAQVETIQERLLKVTLDLETFEKHLRDQKPALDEARKCDHLLETAHQGFQEISQRFQTQGTQYNENQQRYEDLYLKSGYWQEQSITASQKIETLAPFKLLCQPGSSWEEDLTRFLELREGLIEACLSQSSLVWQKQVLEQSSREDSEILVHAREGLERLETAQETLERENSQLNRSGWAGKYELLQNKGKALEKLIQLQDQMVQAQVTLETKENRKAELQEAQTKRLTDLSKLRARIPLVEARHTEAKTHLERLLVTSSENAKAMRQHLQAGKPCPVCGSTEHPFQQASPLDPLLEETRARVAQLNQELVQFHTQITQWERDSNHHEGQITTLDRDIQDAQTILEKQLQLGSGLLQTFPQLSSLSPGSPAFGHALPSLQSEWEREKSALDEKERELNLRQNQLIVYRTAVDVARQRVQIKQTAMANVQHRLLEADHQLQASITLCDSRSEDLVRLYQRLAPAMVHHAQWQTALLKQGLAFIESLKTPVNQLQRATQLLETAKENLQQVTPALAAAKEAANQSRTQMDTLKQQKDDADLAWKTLQKQRKGMLEGKTVATLEAENQKQHASLGDAGKKWRQEKDIRLEQLILSRTQEAQLKTALKNLAEERHRCQQTLDQAMVENQLTMDQALPILQKDTAWAMAQRQTIQHALAAWNQAKGAHEGSEAQLKAHLEAFTDEGALEDAIQARDTAQATKEQLEAETAKLRVQREADEKIRLELGSLKSAFDEQAQKTELWQGMRELIGSHDGKKFRVYAQSLTLDMLLHHANHHLKDLARRYRLERLPGPDLALRIIDREMGDEIRSVNSLSGGETFLVSLALALGLATFTTSQTPVESLFIDEGFGTLDAESLEIALDTLEALQAMGRQVGVISHVQTLVERIAAQVQVRKVGGGHSEVRVRFRQGSNPSD